MPKSLEEFNQEFEYSLYLEGRKAKKERSRSKAATTISNILFCFVIVSLILTAFIYYQNSNTGNNIFGYSYSNVLTTSMQSKLPVGSFILVKAVNPNSLEIGDDITFFKDNGTVVTHRIFNIFEGYKDSGQRGFQTKGIDSSVPDTNITYASKVIGLVVWHIPYLGFVLSRVVSKVFILLILLGILTVLAFFIRIFFKDNSHKVTV